MKNGFFLTIAATLFLTACVGFGTSRPSTFYALKSETAATPVSEISTSVGVEAVRMAVYLDKPQIVTMDKNQMELNVSETNRWAEPLSESIQRVLSEDIASLLPRSTVKSRTFGREEFAYTVLVEVNQMNAVLGEQASLNAWWRLLNKDGVEVYRAQSRLSAPVGNKYIDFVAVQSNLILQLSQDIASEIAKKSFK